ncbi:hypothetical protein J4460_00660 [Candidatus Woesearchaeota archaeon]|nr:hypothetical protein [Candidatus Woesearchaeota archaeon]HIH37895.1 hypothetical protein [Candidatus Woesearchaeota archaeon]HIH48896.1 hypothetical protein [Candidatus Woesearchaeota archaeon]HIJ04022.1 hypothetical protein [Candidatus Woesearchaeota archaeon]
MKKTSQIFHIAFLCTILLFLSACNKGSSIKDFNFQQGTKGVSMSTIKNAPPREIIEKVQFKVGIELHNEGAYDIKDGEGYYRIVLDKDLNWFTQPPYQTLQPDNQGMAAPVLVDFSLRGRQAALPPGEIRATFVDVVSKEVTGGRKVDSKIRVNGCYYYETKAFTDICVNPNIYQVGKTDYVCETKPVSLSGGQGGPIDVTKVEPTIIPLQNGNYKIRFKITAHNRGKGTAYKPTTSGGVTEIRSACVGEKLGDRWNKIKLYAKLSEVQLNCAFETQNTGDFANTEGVGILFNNDLEAVCETPEMTEKTPYFTPLYVHMQYGYTFDEAITISIVNQNYEYEQAHQKEGSSGQ